MAIRNVVHGVAEDAAGLRLLKNGGVYGWQAGRGDDQMDGLKIRGRKLFRDPLYFSVAQPCGQFQD